MDKWGASAAGMRVSEFLDRLQGSGRYTFTAAELEDAVGTSVIARRQAILRLKKKSRVTSPHRGFFVLVPVEYRSAGSPPASWFIGDLMAHLAQPYYVGLLSAAAIHGASHQKPQVFQVVTDAPTRKIEVGRVRIEFHRNRRVVEVPVEQVKTETGFMRVATAEATAIDLIRYPKACGHWGNVATVLVELAEQIDASKLAGLAALAPRPAVQRLGYLLERLGEIDLAEPLVAILRRGRRRVVVLQPGQPAHGLWPDPKWLVIPNADVDTDL